MTITFYQWHPFRFCLSKLFFVMPQMKKQFRQQPLHCFPQVRLSNLGKVGWGFGEYTIYLHLPSWFKVKGSNIYFSGLHLWVQTADALYWSNLTSVSLDRLYWPWIMCFPGSYFSGIWIKNCEFNSNSYATEHLLQPLVWKLYFWAALAALYLPTMGLSDWWLSIQSDQRGNAHTFGQLNSNLK